MLGVAMCVALCLAVVRVGYCLVSVVVVVVVLGSCAACASWCLYDHAEHASLGALQLKLMVT
eukprot:1709368-Karenia_brevis.AAC.1